ncbi:PREDICTED: proto-oncogene Mas-like, partial [Apaloderma vittatum]|uniref:proto-oncogene Mas-like n=1 Tax=Apaloderma vittatum TaxID=57397 RepID=UPI0005215EDB
NLAVADTCFLLCTSAFLVIYHVPVLICLQPKGLQVLRLFHCMVLLTYSTSLYLLTAISVERCSSWQHHPARLYAVVFLTMLFFLLFGIPLSIDIFLNLFGYTNLVFEVCLLLASVNSSINPVTYVLVGSYKKVRFLSSLMLVAARSRKRRV